LFNRKNTINQSKTLKSKLFGSAIIMNAAWKKLESYARELQSVHMRELFEQQAHRFQQFSCSAGPLLFDYSKNRLNQAVVDDLVHLADSCDLNARRRAMFDGAAINNTERRAALHTALRHPHHPEVGDQVSASLEKMERLSEQLRSGEWRGHTGCAITDVVILGIGGSYLGSKLVCEALDHLATSEINIHFVANVDAHELQHTLKSCNPETCVFVVISKSFDTQETLYNAHSALAWCQAGKSHAHIAERHFLAITANHDKAVSFGIHAENILMMWDWVGGRYSLWSAVGFPIVVKLGIAQFKQLLAGAHTMDQHFLTTPSHYNLPVLMGLIGIWNINFLNYSEQAILPYDHRLRSLPLFLQQLDMESNGKHVDRDGHPLECATSPVIFGEAGTNGQHAFHQHLHQGTSIVPCDFIGFAQAAHTLPEHHHALLANMLAQSQAMMWGRNSEETQAFLIEQGKTQPQAEALAPAMSFDGNRPSNMLLAGSLSAQSLGTLLSAYEHKVFVQSVIWNTNAFDQMGVELGKTLSNKILPRFSETPSSNGSHYTPADLVDDSMDDSTRGLLDYLLRQR
jgi:glucose-6-phosphate isomerase